MLAVPDTLALADFTGEPEDGFTDFATQALAQAALLFMLKTGLSDYPDDDNDEQLAKNAILEMAYRIYLERAFAQVRATPFQSETIGSYSYSKGSVVLKAQNSQKTGLVWWDLAIERLSTGDIATTVGFGSIQVFEPSVQVDANGVTWLLGPADAVFVEGGTFEHADTTGM